MIAGVIRAGKSFKSFGDPFEFSATVIIKDDEAFIIGASGKFSRETFKEIKKALLNLGVKKAHWERLKSKVKKITIETKE